MAMRNRKSVLKVKVNSNLAETLKRANLALTNIKQGQHLNITEINNLLQATAWAITDTVDRTPKRARKSPTQKNMEGQNLTGNKKAQNKHLHHRRTTKGI